MKYLSVSQGIYWIIQNRGNYEKIKNAFYKKDILKDIIICPVCNSKDIHILKGDGHKIIGDDLIAFICNDCKKIYEFIDVIYK